MIRAFCTVCQDLIVTGHEATTGPCGHVYHKFCLEGWMKCKKTCPKCRQKIVKPIVLFLDQPNDQGEPTSADNSMLMNQIEQEKALNKEKERKMVYLSSEIKSLEETLTEAKDKCSATEKKLATTNGVCTSLKKQMSYLKQQEGDFAKAKQEATRCRQELQKFERLKMLIEGTRTDAEDMLQRIGEDNNKAPQQLVTQLVILKRELEKIKESRNRARAFKDQYEREISRLKNELSSQEIDTKRTKDQLSFAENDLSRVEKENASLKKKMSKLEQAFNSPSPRSSAITRLMMESPAPMEFKRPRLTPPETYDENEPLVANQAMPPTLFRPDSDMENAAKEMGITLPLVKTTTFSSKTTLKKLPNTLLPQARKRPAGESASVFRTGFNGMGGHSTKFLKPNRPAGKGPVKKVARPNTLSKFVKTTKDGKEPPLPVMTLDFDFS